MFDDALVRRTVALVAAMAMITGAGVAAAADGGSLSAEPAEAGATSTHTATVTVGSQATGSFNGFAVDYSQASGANVSSVSQADVQKIGIDRGDDQSGDAVDVRVGDDLGSVSSSNNGQTLTFGLGGSYQLQEGDEIVVVYESVQNPEAGDYDVSMDVNPQSSGGEATATLSLSASGEVDVGDGTTEDDSSGDDSDGAEAGATVEGDASGGGSVPGFGPGVAVLAVTALALVALRREA